MPAHAAVAVPRDVAEPFDYIGVLQDDGHAVALVLSVDEVLVGEIPEREDARVGRQRREVRPRHASCDAAEHLLAAGVLAPPREAVAPPRPTAERFDVVTERRNLVRTEHASDEHIA